MATVEEILSAMFGDVELTRQAREKLVTVLDGRPRRAVWKKKLWTGGAEAVLQGGHCTILLGGEVVCAEFVGTPSGRW